MLEMKSPTTSRAQTTINFVVLILLASLCLASSNSVRGNRNSCTLFESVGANDLSVNDVVVQDEESNIICIKARFSLAIKVQETLAALGEGEQINVNDQSERTVVLGYLQLDQVRSVENSCPTLTGATNGTEPQTADELKMVVTFECGKLTFNFKRDDKYYLSSIKGFVYLDSSIEVEFVSEQPMFLTSDLTHHFRFNDLIEVRSSVKTEKLHLIANFYNTEIEAYRNTSNRAFVQPADDNSKPFVTVTT